MRVGAHQKQSAEKTLLLLLLLLLLFFFFFLNPYVAGSTQSQMPLELPTFLSDCQDP